MISVRVGGTSYTSAGSNKTVGLRCATAIAMTVFSLLLSGCGKPRTTDPGSSIIVTLPRRGPDPLPSMTDGDGLLLMSIQSKNVVRIRHESIRIENLGHRLQDVFQTRTERLLLVKVEGSVTFGDVMEVLDRASSRVRLKYGLITGRSSPTLSEPSLFMQGELVYTQYFIPTSR